MRERINLTERYGPIPDSVKEEFRKQREAAGELYDLRTARGLSYADVAALTGESLSVIESIEESDYDPRRARRILDKLAKALDAEKATALTSTAAAGGA